MAKKKPSHHSQAQRRNAETQEFVSRYSDEGLYQAIAAVARDVRPGDPEKLKGREFDDNAARVMMALGQDPPPKANAIYMRFNRGLSGSKGKSWRKIVQDALAAGFDPVRRVTVETRQQPAWFQDEGYLVYSFRRICGHLRIELGSAGPPPDTYDRGRRELLEADRRLRRGELLTDLLLTSGQTLVMADKAGWGGACVVAGYEPPARVEPIKGFDPLKILAHYYETAPGLPKSYAALQRHAAAMDIPVPPERTKSDARLSALREELIAERASRGLETPLDGPLPGQEMSPEEIAALLDGAPRLRRKGYWLDLDHTLDALTEYVELYDGKDPLRQKHYLAVSVEHDWPAPSKVTNCAKHNGIATGPGESPFRGMIDLARKRLRERRRRPTSAFLSRA
jgi:hypothetical protein